MKKYIEVLKTDYTLARVGEEEGQDYIKEEGHGGYVFEGIFATLALSCVHSVSHPPLIYHMLCAMMPIFAQCSKHWKQPTVHLHV